VALPSAEKWLHRGVVARGDNDRNESIAAPLLPFAHRVSRRHVNAAIGTDDHAGVCNDARRCDAA
jgi:hypothetical protein